MSTLYAACLCGLALAHSAVAAEPDAAADERLLTEAGLKTDGSALLDFFRSRTLADTDRARIGALIRNLGHDDFEERHARGRVALEEAHEVSRRDRLHDHIVHGDDGTCPGSRGPGERVELADELARAAHGDHGLTAVDGRAHDLHATRADEQQVVA